MTPTALVLIGALATFLAYPPFQLALPSFVCLVPMVILARRFHAGQLTGSRLFLSGAAQGVLANALVLHWLAIALWRFRPWASLWFLPVVLGLGAMSGAALLVASWLASRTPLPLWLTFPTATIAGERLVAGLGPVAFPWLGLGTSLSAWPALVQVAELVGTPGVGWLLALANVVLADACLARPRSPARRLRLAGLVAGVLSSLAYGEIRMATLPVRPLGVVAVLQPNTGYREKWDPTRQDSIIGALVTRSRELGRERSIDLAIWPEAAIPAQPSVRPDWEARIAAGAAGGGVPILAGSLVEGPSARAGRISNGAIWFEPGLRRSRTIYRKRRLVPLLERDPWTASTGAFGGIVAGVDGVVSSTAVGRIAVSICFEGAFRRLAAQDRRQGAEVWVNLANDAWLGPTSGPAQNAAHLVMRAIETRMGVIRAANTGPSLLIDPTGRITARTRFGVPTTLVGPIRTAVPSRGDRARTRLAPAAGGGDN